MTEGSSLVIRQQMTPLAGQVLLHQLYHLRMGLAMTPEETSSLAEQVNLQQNRGVIL